MKKISLLVIVILIAIVPAKACDICGCGVGSYYIGILPDFQKHILGIRYRSNSLRTHLGFGGSTTYLTTEEHYKTLELWGGWNIGKKFRVMASLPVSFNEKINNGVKGKKTGLGDVSVNGYYQLFNSSTKIKKTRLMVQSLWVGAGIKAPTGSYDPADKMGNSNNTNLFQLGSGSVDYTLNAMYDIRIQDAGLNFAASYKMNTANRYNYNYGNKANAALQFYYKKRISKSLLSPNAGITYEQSKKDIQDKFIVDVSGGRLLQATIGAELSYKKITLGGNWQTPLSQNLANGIVKAQSRFMLHVSFIL